MGKYTKEQLTVFEKSVRASAMVFKLNPRSIIGDNQSDPVYKVKKAKRLVVAVAHEHGLNYSTTAIMLKFSKRGQLPIIKAATEYPVADHLVKEALQYYKTI